MADTDARRQWAEQEIERKKRIIGRNQEGIAQLQAFLEMLSMSEVALRNGQAKKAGHRKGRRKRVLADYLIRALAKAGPQGVSIAEVTQSIEASAYKVKGKTKLSIAVTSELARQASRGDRGIVRVEEGRYGLRNIGEEEL